MIGLWDFRASVPVLCAPTQAIVVIRPGGAKLQGQWPQLLPMLDQLDPLRAWLATAGYRVEYLSGADQGAGWAAPFAGSDAQGRAAAVRLALAPPVQNEPDPHEQWAEEAAARLRAEAEAVLAIPLSDPPTTAQLQARIDALRILQSGA